MRSHASSGMVSEGPKCGLTAALHTRASMRPHLARGTGDQGLQLLLAADVGGHHQRLPAAGAYAGGHGLARLGLAAADDDAGAVLGHALGDGAADALAAAGDDRDLAGQVEQGGHGRLHHLWHHPSLALALSLASPCRAYPGLPRQAHSGREGQQHGARHGHPASHRHRHLAGDNRAVPHQQPGPRRRAAGGAELEPGPEVGGVPALPGAAAHRHGARAPGLLLARLAGAGPGRGGPGRPCPRAGGPADVPADRNRHRARGHPGLHAQRILPHVVRRPGGRRPVPGLQRPDAAVRGAAARTQGRRCGKSR